MKLLTSLVMAILIPTASIAGVSGGGGGPRPGMNVFSEDVNPGSFMATGISGGGGSTRPMNNVLGGNSGSGGTRPSREIYESVKGLSADRGEIAFSYKATPNSVPQLYKLRVEEFAAGQEKYLAAVKESFGLQKWVEVKR